MGAAGRHDGASGSFVPEGGPQVAEHLSACFKSPDTVGRPFRAVWHLRRPGRAVLHDDASILCEFVKRTTYGTCALALRRWARRSRSSWGVLTRPAGIGERSCSLRSSMSPAAIVTLLVSVRTISTRSAVSLVTRP